jgi:hypothetical protein
MSPSQGSCNSNLSVDSCSAAWEQVAAAITSINSCQFQMMHETARRRGNQRGTGGRRLPEAFREAARKRIFSRYFPSSLKDISLLQLVARSKGALITSLAPHCWAIRPPNRMRLSKLAGILTSAASASGQRTSRVLGSASSRVWHRMLTTETAAKPQQAGVPPATEAPRPFKFTRPRASSSGQRTSRVLGSSSSRARRRVLSTETAVMPQQEGSPPAAEAPRLFKFTRPRGEVWNEWASGLSAAAAIGGAVWLISWQFAPVRVEMATVKSEVAGKDKEIDAKMAGIEKAVTKEVDAKMAGIKDLVDEKTGKKRSGWW